MEITFKDCFERVVLVDLLENRAKLFRLQLTRKVRRGLSPGRLSITLQEVDQRLRAQDSLDALEDTHAVTDVAAESFEGHHPLVPFIQVRVHKPQGVFGQRSFLGRNLSFFKVGHRGMLDEGGQIGKHIGQEPERPNDKEKDPEHKFVGLGDTVGLAVNEDHNHLVEHHFEEGERVDANLICKEHCRGHQEHWKVGYPKNHPVPQFRVLAGQQKGGQQKQKHI